MDAVETLMQFELTRREALIYLELISQGNMNGYEVAKNMGLSRSNAYTSLASLVDKGCAYAIEGATVQYTPVAVEEFCGNKIRKLRDAMEYLCKAVPERKEPDEQGYVTIKGKSNILNKMRNMVLEAQERLYLSASAEVLKDVLTEIKGAAAKGIKVVLITDSDAELEGAVVYKAKKADQQIRLIVDSANVLTGDIEYGENSACLYSKKKNIVDLIKDSLKNEIKIIEMTKGNC